MIAIALRISVDVDKSLLKDTLSDLDSVLFQQFFDIEQQRHVVDVGQGVGRRAFHRIDECHMLNVYADIGEGLEQSQISTAQFRIAIDNPRSVMLQYFGQMPR